MNINQQLIGLYTLIYREMVRMFRIASQVFLPPVITTFLYFVIFGNVIGSRVGTIQDSTYSVFIAPGLIMMSVITNAYSNVSTSLFSARFQKNIEEILISPIHYTTLLLGYTLSGVFRAIIVAFLVYLVAWYFVDMDLNHLPMTLLVLVLVASLFAQAGFTNGMLARTFDDVALVPTFILGPMTYLGGVFYAVSMLPTFWQKVSYFNPIFYMVNALRQSMIGHQNINMSLAMSVICIILIFMTILNLVLLKRGIGLRE